MTGFFSPHHLEGTRLLVLQGGRVANPDFYPMLRGLGFKNLPDQSGMGAITFSDVVVSHEPFSSGLFSINCLPEETLWLGKRHPLICGTSSNNREKRSTGQSPLCYFAAEIRLPACLLSSAGK